MKKTMLTLAAACMVATAGAQTPDPNFHIYLCYGQSNMEGAGAIEQVDRDGLTDQFQMMAAVNFSNPQRTMYNWYRATPPLVRQGTGLGPTDWFGRTMVDNLPDVKIGVVCVAIGGAGIQHLDKDFDPATLANEADWFRNFMAAYDNNPYGRLIECAKKAQESGVIKGILIHQGETNNMDPTWPTKLNKLYNDILTDLNLQAEDVPIFVGETVRSELGGYCGGHNSVIANVPNVIPTAHVVSSALLPHRGDGLHFTSHAYRVLGTRYAVEALKLMGINDPVITYSEEEPEIPQPEPSDGDYVLDFSFFNPSFFGDGSWDADTHTFVGGQWGCGGWEFTTPIDLSGYQYLVAELEEPQTNHAQLRVWDTPGYFDKSYERDFDNNTLLVGDLKGMMKNLDSGITPVNTEKIYRIGIWCYGGQPIRIKHIFATNNDPYNTGLTSMEAHDNSRFTVFNLAGQCQMIDADQSDVDGLHPGIYIVNGKKVKK